MAEYGTFEGEPGMHPVPRSKAPWKSLRAESYSLFLKLKELPQGTYDEFEKAWDDEGTGKFAGGLGAVIIVRYSDTPVGKYILGGPYDEIMFVPGNFTVPSDGNTPKVPKKALRISRIYVSQRTTTYNGRLNWNIPKHLARFQFSAPPILQGQTPPQSLTVQVFPPGTKDGDGVAPFFACTIKPWQWFPALPINTKYIPMNLTLAQPPIPEPAEHRAAVKAAIEGPKVDEYDLDPEKSLAVLPGTDRWCAFDISATSPRARGCWVEVHEPSGEVREGDKVYFPRALGAWRVGGWMEDVNWVLGDVTEWKL